MNDEIRTDSFDRARQQLSILQDSLAQSVVGHDLLLRDLVTAILAGGHVLIEGLPGLGKTRLTRCLSSALGLSINRIQCTPDLMPGDISGAEVLQQGPNGQEFVFRKGPVFANLVLVDEINRASPKTQSALLEAMQERQVTYLGETHALPRPFRVLATQNPIELEGTYPLPEAQLDRFLFKLKIDMPDARALSQILELTLTEPDGVLPAAVFAEGDLESLGRIASSVVISEPVRAAAISLVLATQPGHENAAAASRDFLRYGSSPRGLQALVRSAQVRALQCGRAHVAIEDLEQVALPALRHRILLSVEAEIQGRDPDAILQDITRQWLSSLQ